MTTISIPARDLVVGDRVLDNGRIRVVSSISVGENKVAIYFKDRAETNAFIPQYSSHPDSTWQILPRVEQ